MAGDGSLRVRVCDAHGRPVRAGGLAAWLEAVAPARTRGVVAVAIVSDARVRALNRRYRRIDHATDVLSFPSNPAPGTKNPARRTKNPVRRTKNPALEPHPAPGTMDPEPLFLGDIVIASGVSRRQARHACHDHAIELRVLALHGLLHLLGYDHERDGGRMRRIEARLRRKGGLERSLIERAAVTREERARRSRVQAAAHPQTRIRSVSDGKRGGGAPRT